MRRLFVTLIGVAATAVLLLGGGIVRSPAADAATPVRDIAFPVRESVDYEDTFGACRDGCSRYHEGQDLIGHRLNHLLAATDATVTYIRDDAGGTAGNWIKITDQAGWSYSYMHVNNDAPSTDDGTNPARWRFASGIEVGAKVQRGQFIAYMGDSGNAEGSVPHVHFEIRTPNGTPINAYDSLQLAEGKPVTGICGPNTAPTPSPHDGTLPGYFAVGENGAVDAFGTANHAGDRSDDGVSAPIVGIAATPSGQGYWLAARDGNVYQFGDAGVGGNAKSMKLAATVIGIAATPNGAGFWLATDDGAIYPFGSARSYGSALNRPLTSPVVDIVSTATGRGYFIVTDRGVVYAYGDAQHRGDATDKELVSPITSIVSTSSGNGYWLLSRRGGLLAYGDAEELGTIPTRGLCDPAPAADLIASAGGGGYGIMQTDGTVLEFGNAASLGDAHAGTIVDVVAVG
jgi:hypothetical protein